MSRLPLAGEKEIAARLASIEQHVEAIIVDRLGVDENKVALNASFVEGLCAVELMAFEHDFEIPFADEDLEKIRTVKDVAGCISSHVKGLK